MDAPAKSPVLSRAWVGATPALVVRSGQHLAALPVADIVETLRPLRVEAVAGTPACVRGLAVVRGRAIPVIDLAAMLSSEPGAGRRWVVLRVARGDDNARRIALAVDDVVGLRTIAPSQLGSLPPLLAGDATRSVAAVGALDGEVLVLLDSARAVTDELWTSLEQTGGGAPS